MTKKEELLNLDDEDLYKYIEKFCHERYFKLNTIPHYFKKGDMGQPYIQNDVVNIPYYEACKGSGDYDSFDIPIDYLFMTDEEILEDMALKKPIKATSLDEEFITIPKPKFKAGDTLKTIDYGYIIKADEIFYDLGTGRWLYNCIEEERAIDFYESELELVEVTK